MAKNKSKSEATADDVSLTPRQRAERALISQGRAAGLLPGMSAGLQERLAEFCTPAGEIQRAAVEGVRDVLVEYYAEQKAVVDEQGEGTQLGAGSGE